jgi:hypothetical protein
MMYNNDCFKCANLLKEKCNKCHDYNLWRKRGLWWKITNYIEYRKFTIMYLGILLVILLSIVIQAIVFFGGKP